MSKYYLSAAFVLTFSVVIGMNHFQPTHMWSIFIIGAGWMGLMFVLFIGWCVDQMD